GDQTIAEDLVHDTFVALPDALRRFRGDAAIDTFIVAIAARKAYKHVRTAQRRRAAERRLANEPLGEPPRPDAEVERAELARLLTDALDRLPVDQRVA